MIQELIVFLRDVAALIVELTFLVFIIIHCLDMIVDIMRKLIKKIRKES